MNVAIIPGRGGSKRTPRKNIREFCGRPMVAWSIQAASDSGVFERVIVSTDDPGLRQSPRGTAPKFPSCVHPSWLTITQVPPQ